jgi:hypothetical protein
MLRFKNNSTWSCFNKLTQSKNEKKKKKKKKKKKEIFNRFSKTLPIIQLQLLPVFRLLISGCPCT